MLLVLLTFHLSAAAGDTFSEEYTRLLIPLTAKEVRGANGSVWTTEWTVFNGGSERLYVVGPFPYIHLSPMVQDNDVAPRATKRLILDQAEPGRDGAFVYVPAALLDAVPMSLRVRDLSVNAQSYGTSIPIVRPRDFRPAVQLIDVPTDPAYRLMLRIYSAAPRPQLVRVSIYTPGAASPVEQHDVVLQPGPDAGAEDMARPAYAQLDPLSAAARNAAQTVRIEVSTVGDEGAATPIWAFVSIAHNQTQQVTTVLP